MKGKFALVVFMVVLIGCAAETPGQRDSRSTDPRMVVGRTWQWVSTVTPVETIEVPSPERYAFSLKSDGRAKIRFDCNRGGGRYEISEGQLSFGPLMSTKMACPQDSLDGRFAKDLQQVSSFFLHDGTLCLELPYDSGTMQFREALYLRPKLSTPAEGPGKVLPFRKEEANG